MADAPRYPVPGSCPVCGNELAVTRLRCGHCGTAVEGLFNLGRFYYLTREQQQFIAVFVKCRGKIKDVEEELGISYPTVVARLDEVIGALEPTQAASPAPAVPMPAQMSEDQRKLILDELSAGRLTSEEALSLLQGQDLPALDDAPKGAAPAAGEE